MTFATGGTKGRTVFLAVDQGFAARYLLQTEILDGLVDSGARVVVLVPNADDAKFSRELSARGVVVEPLRLESLRAGPVERVLRSVRLYVMNGRQNLRFVDLRYQILKRTRPSGTVQARISNAAFDATVSLLRKSRRLRSCLIGVESWLFCRRPHRASYARHRPADLVVTSLGTLGVDHYLLREARAEGVRRTSVVLSWDNTTTKGMSGAMPDRVVAWSERMRRELTEYCDVPPDQVRLGGVAHFDVHHRRARAAADRAKFCDRFGLDASRAILLFAVRSPNGFPWNPELVSLLADAVRDDRFGQPAQIIVRVHPLYLRGAAGERRFQKDLDALRALETRDHVVLDVPALTSEALPMNMERAEMDRLADVLRHADVLLSYFSTVMLEASFYDLPIVNVCLRPYNSALPDNMTDALAGTPHIGAAIATGGMRSAYSVEELHSEVGAYLRDRSRDREGRRRLNEEFCGAFAGGAGRRIAQEILSP